MRNTMIASALLLASFAAHAGTVSTVAGAGIAGASDGAAHEATFNRPTWLDVDAYSGNIYVVDRANRALRRIGNGRVQTLPTLTSYNGLLLPPLDYGGPYGGGIAVEPHDAGCGSAEWGAGFFLVSTATNQIAFAMDWQGSANVIGRAGRDGAPTVLGTGNAGNLDGDAEAAEFSGPGDVALSWGYGGHASTVRTDRLYIADTANHTIRRVTYRSSWECTGPSEVGTLAGASNQPGSFDGEGATARFHAPRGVATAPDGSVYVADTGNHTIRRIAPDGRVTTVAGVPGVAGSGDGLATQSLLHNPSGIDVNELGEVFIADTGNFVVRKLTTDGDLVTIAGRTGVAGYVDGPALNALFSGPIGLRVVGSSIYIADTANNVIRKLDLTSPEPRRRATRH